MKRLIAISAVVLVSMSLVGCWGRKNDDRTFVSTYSYESLAGNVVPLTPAATMPQFALR